DFATWVVDNRHTWIMPMVNPDGSHIMGRMNAQGVNINRNYPVIWGGEGTDILLNNPGPSPGSEIETQINIEWFNITRPDYYASIHCCGNLWLFPYGEDGYDPADVDMMNDVCAQAFPQEIQDACGPIWSTIYPASGSSVDTAYEYTGAVSFGFEMSGRSNLAGPWGEPVTFAEVFDQERESWQGIRHAFEQVHRYGAYLDIENIEANGQGLDITLRNTGMGNSSAGSLRYIGAATFGEVDLPVIPVNGTATVFVNGDAGGGENQIVLEYNKRIWHTSNVREAAVPVLAYDRVGTEFSNGTWLVPVNANADAPADGLDVPTLPMGLLVAGLALIAWRRR
ncbi:MAG: M14 family metallopeptidase, partial [Thermoplasmatota archaeon]